MTALILREGNYLGWHDDFGYVYRLNGSIYGYLKGTTTLLKN